MRRVGVGIVLLTLLAGMAGASVQGEVDLDGPLRLDAGGIVRGPPLALYVDETEDLADFTATFDWVKITVYKENAYAARGVSVAHPTLESVSFILHAAQLHLVAGDHSGWAGLYPSSASQVELALPPGASLEALDQKDYGGVVSPTKNPEEPEKPSAHSYDQDVQVPHVNAESRGVARYVGAGAMKFQGLDVEIEAAENTTRYVTGVQPQQEAGTLAVNEHTWLFLEFVRGEIVLDVPTPVDVAFAHAELEWSGAARISPRNGTLLVDGRDMAQEEGNVELVGDLVGVAKPVFASGQTRLRLSVQEQRTASVSPIPGAPEGTFSPTGILLLLGVAAGAGSLAVWTVRRRFGRGMDADEMLTLAHLAGEGGRHDEALGWVRRARGLAPQSGVLALEEGFHLGELGLVDEALATYREAARLSDDGQAEFDAALLAHRASALGDAEIEALLVGALEKNPGLVLELDESLGMRLRPSGSPELEAAIRRAHEQLDRR